MLGLLVASAAILATGSLAGARLARGSASTWALAAFVLAFAEVVLLSLATSALGAFSRWPLLLGALAVLAATAAATRRDRPPPLRPVFPALRDAVREPAIAAVAVVAAAAVAYSLALAVIPAPNDEDALSYHLARAALWTQQERIGSIDGALDTRLDAFAPNAEIAMAFTMALSGSGRYATLVQLLCALAAAVAVAALARRLGLGTRESVLGGLLFLTAPVVLLQASTALTDVVVGALVATAAALLLGRTRAELVLAAVAVALLVGTKLTGILSLPGLALLVVVARRRAAVAPLVALAAGSLAGCYWYALNVLQGRDAFGRIGGERVDSDLFAAAGRVIRLALAAFETPGAIGLDRVLYVVAAVGVAVVCLRRGCRTGAAAVGAGAVLLPLALIPVDHLLLRASQKGFAAIGESDAGFLDPERSATKASPIFSWYGALGTLLTALAIVIAVRAVRRRELPAAAAVAAAAPVLWIVLLGIGVPYWEWNGRYAIGGFAIGAALWGLVLRWPALGLATAAVVAVTTLLAFAHQHDRPSGLRLLEPTGERSLWTEPDWRLQATDNPHLIAIYRFFEEHVPLDAPVAVEPEVWPGGANIGGNLPAFPFFGRDLTRTVRLASSPDAARAAGAEWTLLRRPDEPRCEPGWRRAFRYEPWTVLRRDVTATCNGGA
jgi:hypothetical protein